MFLYSGKAPIKNRCAVADQNAHKYLMASWLYYEKDYSVMSDDEFDMLCVMLSMDYDSITHWGKYLIDKEALDSGTGHHLVGRIPGAIIAQAKLWRNEIERDNK